MEPKSPSPHSQETATSPYGEHNQYTPRPPILHKNNMYLETYTSWKRQVM
jgi:hypothetical protein